MVSFPERGWPERNGSPVRNLTGHFTMASVGVWKDSDLTWSPASRESPHLDFFFPSKPVISKVCGFRQITSGHSSCLHPLTEHFLSQWWSQ